MLCTRLTSLTDKRKWSNKRTQAIADCRDSSMSLFLLYGSVGLLSGRDKMTVSKSNLKSSASAQTVFELSENFGEPQAATLSLCEGLDHIRKTCSRQVNFYQTVRVILIPTRNEFLSAGLRDVLWWNGADYDSFVREALSEQGALRAEDRQYF